MPKKLRKIKKVKITHISLCPKGANQMETMFKSDEVMELNTLVKERFEEEGIVYGIIYSPNIPDSQGDFADSDMIKQMMHSFAKTGEGIDIKHDFETLSKDDAYVVESFLVQEGDPRFSELKNYDGKEIDPTGSWAVAIKIDNEELRQKYRDGEWKGLSMGGKYQAEEVEEDEASLLQKAIDVLSKFVGASSQKPKDKPQTGDTEVTPEELAKAISDGLAEGLKPVNDKIDDINERLTKVEQPEEVKDPAEDKVEVDLTDRKAVEAQLKALQKSKLEAEVDVNDIEALEKHLATFEDDAKPEPKDKPSSARTLTKSDLKKEEDLVDELAKTIGL